ncbi:MAG: hypothetical protein B6229_07295 [Spirochaetaceae bacterium 4572_7]|nr:MAG: hypothetical protein B6229_07295 [Spirochaetaceae bacterium 4572_7]
MKRVAVLIASGFEDIEAVTIIDVLRRGDIDVVTLGVGEKTVKSAHGLVVVCDETVEHFSGSFDGVILPGGMPGAKNIGESSNAIDLICNLNNNGKLIGAICAAPGVVLGHLNILDNREFTCYPSFETRVPNGIFLRDNVVVSDNIVTSRGPGTALEFSFKLVEILQSKSVADELKKRMLIS